MKTNQKLKSGKKLKSGSVILQVLATLILALRAGGQPFGGIVAQSDIDFNGNQVIVDSFDSSTNTHSLWQTNSRFHGMTYGVWSPSLSYISNNTPANPSRTANARLVSYSGLLNIGYGAVAGYVETTTNGSISAKTYGYIGDLAWVFNPVGNTPGNATMNIQPGHCVADIAGKMYFSYARPRFATWLPIPQPTGTIRIGSTWTNIAGTWTNFGGITVTNSGSGFNIGGIPYALVITNGPQNTNSVYYAANQLSQSVFIDAPNVVLYLTNGTAASGRYYLTLNTNADVRIWSGGDIDAADNMMINNLTGYAPAFSVYDNFNPIIIKLRGNLSEAGNYYVPNALVEFCGNPVGDQDFVGNIVCYNVAVLAKMNFHYDESLGFHQPPDIIRELENQIVSAGSNVTFSVTAGPPPVQYRWFKDQSTLIGGANENTLTLTNAQLSDAGNYTVIVTNLYGAVMSSATLTVFTNATASLKNLSFNRTNGVLEFRNFGVAGLTYTIQASTDLVNWVSLQTNIAPFTFTETNSFPRRFYRSVYFP